MRLSDLRDQQWLNLGTIFGGAPAMFNFLDDKSHQVTVILRLALIDRSIICI